MDESTELILEMLQGGITTEKAWMLTQLVIAMAILALLWRGAQLIVAGAELYFNGRLRVGTWLYVSTNTGQVRHKVLKKGLFRTYFYNYDNESLVVKSNIKYVKEDKDYMPSIPSGINGSDDKNASDFGL